MSLYSDIAAIPQIKRGMVWCRKCGASMRVNGERRTLVGGWPKCCGQTMTIDSPIADAMLAAREK